MAKTVEFFFDFRQPDRVPGLDPAGLRCARTRRPTLVWRPMLLGAVFKATGQRQPGDGAGQGPLDAPGSGALGRALPRAVRDESAISDQHADADARRGGNAAAPARRFRALRAGGVPRDVGAAVQTWAMRTCWRRCCARPGWMPRRCWRRRRDAAVKARLAANTDEAVARGVFGAPTVFVGEQMFFGQDRLDFVREALR
jgi:2-hydroxychromene-2-carboxylate isomerase